MAAEPRPPATPPPPHLKKRAIPKKSAMPRAPPAWTPALLTGPPPPVPNRPFSLWRSSMPTGQLPPVPPPPARWQLQTQLPPPPPLLFRPPHAGCADGNAARPAKKRQCHCSAAQPALSSDVGNKRIKRELRSSAEQLAHCGDVVNEASEHELRGVAEQPADSGDVDNKRIKCEQPDRRLLTSVAYLHLPEIPEKNYQKSEGRRCTIEALQQAKAVGADVINMVFQRGSDIDLIWDDLKQEMQASDGHPELDYRRLQQMLTIFSPNFGVLLHEDPLDFYEFATGVPNICLTFSGLSDSGNIVVFNVACPRLSLSERQLLLDTYSNESLEEMGSIRLIGGAKYFLPY